MATLAVSQDMTSDDPEAGSFGCVMNLVGSWFDALEDYAFDYPGKAGLTIEMLDHFAVGDAEADIPQLSQDFEMELLALVRWWSGLQHWIDSMWHPYPRDERPPVPGLDEAESAMKRVRLALAAVITDTPEEDNPLPDFLRAYRLWTRSICEMGRKGWPAIDWGFLDEVV